MKLILLILLLSSVSWAQNPQPSNTLKFGNGSASNKKLVFNRGGSNPQIRWDESSSKLQFSNDGSTFADLVSANFTEKNYLINSKFDLWQRGTSLVITNGQSKYLADQWYVKNSLGTNGEITFDRISGSLDGSKYAARIQISQAPTAAQANGTELYQVLENKDSLQLYNKTASLSVNLKAMGNVTQMGIQFFYAATEVQLTTAIGSETTCTVNTSSYTLCSINGQALGTSQTTAGVVGIRIRPTAVSSGNLYDLNNGYSVEQVMLNKGSQVATYSPAGKTVGDEVLLAERFYSKSYDIEIDPGSINSNGAVHSAITSTAGTSTAVITWLYPVRMRAVPTVTIYNANDGSTGSCRDSSGSDVSFAGIGSIGETSDTITNTGSASSGRRFGCQFTADAAIP